MRDVPNTRRARLPLAALSLAAGAPRRGIQIGPRIRVGGDVGRIGQNIKETVGKGAAKAAPFVSLVNPALGAGLALGGKVLDTTNGGTDWSDLPGMAVKAGTTAYGGKIAGNLLNKIPGVSSVTSAISDRAKGLLEHVPDSLRGMVSGGGSDGQGSFGALGDELGRVKSRVLHGESPIAGLGGGGGDGGMSLLDKLLMGGTVAAGAMDELDKRNLRNKATDYATGSYDARAPLRSRAMALLADDQPRDMTSVFSDPGNVYDRQRRARALIAAPAPAPTPTG